MMINEFTFITPEVLDPLKIVVSDTNEFGKIACIPINIMKFFYTPKDKIFIEDYIKSRFDHKTTYWKFDENKYTLYYGTSEDGLLHIGLFDLEETKPLNFFLLSQIVDKYIADKIKILREFFKLTFQRVNVKMRYVSVV